MCDINVQTSVHCKVAEVTGRPLAAYLALPPDDYSVLDSRCGPTHGPTHHPCTMRDMAWQ